MRGSHRAAFELAVIITVLVGCWACIVGTLPK